MAKEGVMRNPAIPRSWLFVLSMAVALTGCTSLDARTGAGGAAPGSIELEVGYDSERPVELRVPAPNMNADMAQAMKEIGARRRADPLMPEQPAGLPDLDPAVTEGIQGLEADKGLRR
jgi:hypothetical protein